MKSHGIYPRSTNSYHLQTNWLADNSGCAVESTKCIRSLEFWGRGIVTHSRHGCYVCVSSVFVLPRVGNGLATRWSPVQGVLPNLYTFHIFWLILNGNRPEGLIRQRKMNEVHKVLLEKLKVAYSLTKFSEFYRNRRFTTVFVRARHWSLSWTRWIQSIPASYFPKTLYLLILSSHLGLGLPSGPFLRVFLPKPSMYSYITYVVLILPISSSFTWSQRSRKGGAIPPLPHICSWPTA
jgi:hypothetical protein